MPRTEVLYSRLSCPSLVLAYKVAKKHCCRQPSHETDQICLQQARQGAVQQRHLLVARVDQVGERLEGVVADSPVSR